MKKFLFITTNNLATNPRLLKEVNLAVSLRYNVTVIMFSLNNWSEPFDSEIRNKLETVHFIIIPAYRKPFLQWLYASFIERIHRLIPNNFLSLEKLSFSVSKRSYQLLSALKKMKLDFDWIIAHNPGAFYPAYFVVQQSSAKLGIDVEDYHPGETCNQKLQTATKRIMLSILPASEYCSYASPLIMQEVLRDIPKLLSRQVVILNSFSKDEFAVPRSINNRPLRLVWFSQNINYGRGLEFVIPVIHELYPSVELHLIGQIQPEFSEKELSYRNGVIIHPVLPQKQLHYFLSFFDVGLAIDVPINKNRDIALTNKLLAYAQAGLYILAFDTKGQREFLENSELSYVVSDNNKNTLKEQFLKLLNSKEEIRLLSPERYYIGKLYSWESESKKLLRLWEN